MNTRDQQILDVLDRLMQKFQAGNPVPLDEALGPHPEIADEVRSLWATMLFAENMAVPIASEIPSPPDTRSSAGFAKPSLPDYELLEEIGRGGMGVVFRARQHSLNRQVAVKMMIRGDLAAPASRARFQSEAHAVARLAHPNVVSIYEVGEGAGHLFFSMPFVDGTTLSRRLLSGPLSCREAAELLIPICRAVEYAHSQGILHRDLKPSNILIDRQGRPFVSDFGLAKRLADSWSPEEAVEAAASLTETGAILGTPAYMAPEQAAHSRSDLTPTTDVYSLGAILYACVTGRPPVLASNPVDALLMLLEQDPPLPRVLNPSIDGDLEMILLKALQKPEDLRYASAGALADDLQAYLNHEPVSARSSQFKQVLVRAFRPTHHVGVLENWGLLWILHGAVILLLCLITEVLRWRGVTSRLPYMGFWILGLGAWGIFFWNLRRRSGPVTFVERQVAHTWAASMASSSALFGLEYLLGLEVLTLSPVLALIAGSVFLVKAGILSGEFYIPAGVLYVTAFLMAVWPQVSVLIFGVVSSAIFVFYGMKYHRLRRTNLRVAEARH